MAAAAVVADSDSQCPRDRLWADAGSGAVGQVTAAAGGGYTAETALSCLCNSCLQCSLLAYNSRRMFSG